MNATLSLSMPHPAELAGATVLSLTVEPWASPWLTHQPVMLRLSRRHNVLYTLNEPTLDDVLDRRRRRATPPGGLQEIAPRLCEMRTSRLFPRVYASERLNDLSTRLRAWQIRQTLKRLGWSEPIAYAWNPLFAPLIRRLKPRLSVFHAHDYYPAFFAPGTAARREMERAFIDLSLQADVLFAASESVASSIIQATGRKPVLVENGVDYESLNRSAAEPPPAWAALPRPRIGYIGRVNRKVDIAALETIAYRRPGWSVIVMGPQTGWSAAERERFQTLLARPNVHAFPGVPPTEIGRYMAALDVGLMNYVTEGTWTSYGFPLKMFEYFAVGTPAVGTDLPSIRKYQPLVRLVKRPEEWIPAIEQALAESRRPQARADRQALARQNTWDDRVALIEATLAEAWAKSRGRHP